MSEALASDTASDLASSADDASAERGPLLPATSVASHEQGPLPPASKVRLLTPALPQWRRPCLQRCLHP
ncbi:hypothetical protein NL676_008774 [Syzygium grande]|nr:hypothetical protein NL676_008774 [Syzygium grande]